ncbi:ABC transporter permease [Blastococcus aggregatus]|uniref:ABC transporter permease n=1 Tax=Blastococcus aggregatus TaxID=38502 RepID=UPI001596CEA7|nr:ABC transporter permease subunit [Blastococcus aggregatus]
MAILLLCWELLPRLLGIPSGFLVPLSEALQAGGREGDAVLAALWPTVSAVLAALTFTWVVGVVVGFLVGSMPGLRFVGTFFGILYAVPFVILYPLLSVWIGPGQLSKIAFACLYGFIPVVLTAAAGVRGVDENLYRSARSMGASRRQLMTKVLLPASMPVILSGLRLGGGLVLIAVIVAEMLASTSGGMGTLITAYRVQFDAAAVYFCIIVVLVLALIMDQSLAAAERWAARGRSVTVNTVAPG